MTQFSIKEIKNINKNNLPIISVYGSSTCKPGSKLYNKAYQLGKELGTKFVVTSGGYTGIMDGISKGVFELNGISIGITTDEITKVDPSKYLSKEIREPTLMSRLQLIQNIADIHLFLPGGTGTLTELALIWDKQKLGLLPLNPVVLLGNTWHKIFNLMFKENLDVVKSNWKLDSEVEQNTTLLSSEQEFKIWLSSYIKGKKKK